MNSKIIKIQNVSGGTITLEDGISSSVYEYYPDDCEQKSYAELETYYHFLKNFLHNYEPRKEGFQSVKFYSLEGRTFINCDANIAESLNITKKEYSDIWKYYYGGSDPSKSVVINKDDYFKINTSYFRVFSLFGNYPEFVDPNHFNGVCDFAVFFRKIDKKKSEKAMERKRNIFISSFRKEKMDIDGTSAYKAAEEHLLDLKNGKELQFYVEFFFIIKASTEEDLNNKTKELKKTLSNANCEYLMEAESLTEIFPSLLFGLNPIYKRAMPCKSSYLLNLLPLTRDFLLPYGSRFFSRNLNEVMINLDDGSSSNGNLLISGPSGQGKSVVGQKIIRDEILKGSGGIIFDLGYSFLKFAKYEGATIFTQKFNPLQFKEANYLFNFVMSLIPASELNEKFKGKLLFLITRFVNENNEKDPTLRILVNYLESEIEDIQYYFECLWPYITDEILPIHSFVYVDVKEFPTKIYAPLMVHLLEYYENIPGRKVFIFDEVWKFMETLDSFIEEKSRTIRKDFSSLINISQNLDDFINNKAGLAFIQSCAHKILFNQVITSEAKFLSSDDKSMLESCKGVQGMYSEFLYKSDIHRKPVRYYQTKFEYYLFTSHKPDNERINKYFEKFHNGNSYKDTFDLFINSI